MPKVIDHKTQAVTLGVIDRNLAVHDDLHQVTFDDVFGTRHTVHYHKDGPFNTPEGAIEAFYEGTLHAFPDHESAAVYEDDRGNHDTARLYRSLDSDRQQQGQQGQGGGY